MEVRLYDKRPLTVGAFRFDGIAARDALAPGSLHLWWRGVNLRWEGGPVWQVYNPGRAASDDPWQRVVTGDYIIIAPTGCRYPVQADQFERNYAEVGGEAERTPVAA